MSEQDEREFWESLGKQTLEKVAKDEAEADLQEILDCMKVPILRRHDFRWLARNLPMRNQDSPDLSVAMSLVSWFIKNP